jgi:hypothetical protein
MEVMACVKEQVGEHTHAGTNLEDGHTYCVSESVGDALRHCHVGQEVLT